MIVFRALTVAALLLAAACTGSSGGSQRAATGGSSGSTSTVGARPPSSSRPLSGTRYLSLGDSYAAGYQPGTAGRPGGTSRNGFAYQVVRKAAAGGLDLRLTNLGCSGATTRSVLTRPGCAPRFLGPGASPYAGTQADAAAAYLRAHRGDVALVTVALGGNDVARCADSADSATATTCVTGALREITTNLATLAQRLRAAAGPTTRIVGITYPDVFLGEALSADAERRNVASLSVFAFRSLINPQLASAYRAVGGTLVDVTAATGAYGSLDRRTTLAPYGSIPEPVARICTLTYYCALRDIHPRTLGYGIIADLVVRTLPRR